MSQALKEEVIRRDGSAGSTAKAWLRALELTAPIAGNPDRILPAVILEVAAKMGDAPALLSDQESFTYRELATRTNQYARWALDQGLRKGDVVCLLMASRPEFMAIWLGITSAGAVVSLLNTNLAGPSLAHCIHAVSPKHIIVSAEFAKDLADALVPRDLESWRFGRSIPAHRSRNRLPFRRALEQGRAAPGPHRRPGSLHLHVRHHRAAQGRAR
jgi:fatty-acyl-CoA synthase